MLLSPAQSKQEPRMPHHFHFNNNGVWVPLKELLTLARGNWQGNSGGTNGPTSIQALDLHFQGDLIST